MDQFNKVFSFILGLVVVVVFIAFASGKINLGGKKPLFSGFLSSKTTPTPTPTSVQKTSSESVQNTTSSQNSATYHSYLGTDISTKTPSSIPNTGIPVFFFPFAISSLAGGVFLQKTSKKKD